MTLKCQVSTNLRPHIPLYTLVQWGEIETMQWEMKKMAFGGMVPGKGVRLAHGEDILHSANSGLSKFTDVGKGKCS